MEHLVFLVFLAGAESSRVGAGHQWCPNEPDGERGTCVILRPDRRLAIEARMGV